MPLESRLRIQQHPGEVRFTLIVRNQGTEPVALEFKSGQHVEVTVAAEDAEIWRWSDGRMFTQSLETEQLDPDEAVRYPCTWDTPSPGQYRVTAELTATNASLTERTDLTI